MKTQIPNEILNISDYDDRYEAIKNWLEDEMTVEDIDAWHQAELTNHMGNLLDALWEVHPNAEVQIWGGGSSDEPLHVHLSL